ncbi:type IV secretion protein DotU [Chromatium weissei]|nr:type IV secretion protein DotU [Chromatium weissei]
MANDDPFAIPTADGPTVIRPMPGGRAKSSQPPFSKGGLDSESFSKEGLEFASFAPASEFTSPIGFTPPFGKGGLGGISSNPLLTCANGILTIAAQVRGTAAHPDPEGLREGFIQQMRDFENCARVQGLVDAVVLPARYVLCALVDEAVLDTPWGTQSVWSNRGLLISFHNETWGGEKFFTALERLLTQPRTNLNLLELMYLCLALGFEGRYRVREGGRDQLNQIREQLFQTIRSQRGESETELSPHWRGSDKPQNPLRHALPLWVFSTLAAVTLLALFTAFSFALNRDSDPVYLSLNALDQRLPALAERDAPAPLISAESATALTLRKLLAEDIAAGRLTVANRPLGQTVILRGDDLFASGSVTIKPAYLLPLRHIAEALAQLPGMVLVTGHTDSVPIQTLRFPSNWHLSQERAQRVSTLLAELTGNSARFTAEGRAESEPLVPENSKDARNRRVEVMLITPADSTVSPLGAPH